MALVAAVVSAEKILPSGRVVAAAAALIASGAVLFAVPHLLTASPGFVRRISFCVVESALGVVGGKKTVAVRAAVAALDPPGTRSSTSPTQPGRPLRPRQRRSLRPHPRSPHHLRRHRPWPRRPAHPHRLAHSPTAHPGISSPLRPAHPGPRVLPGTVLALRYEVESHPASRDPSPHVGSPDSGNSSAVINADAAAVKGAVQS
jgi:hypothetical protein